MLKQKRVKIRSSLFKFPNSQFLKVKIIGKRSHVSRHYLRVRHTCAAYSNKVDEFLALIFLRGIKYSVSTEKISGPTMIFFSLFFGTTRV